MLETRSLNDAGAPAAAQTGPLPDLPPGDHPVEVAARAGFGPLSPLAHDTWHGHAVPCVSCGQLVRRGQTACDHCEQNLTPEMLDKMRAYAGPWYVYEHVRPFPGVTFDRLVRQVRRGLLTETSIVRGPTTDHQWRFAVETPGLSRHFGRCWKCHAEALLTQTQCPQCGVSLLGDTSTFPSALVTAGRDPLESDCGSPKHTTTAQGIDTQQEETALPAPEWEALRDVISTSVPPRRRNIEASPNGEWSRSHWTVGVLMIIALLALFGVIGFRSSRTANAPPSAPISESLRAIP